MEVSNKRNPDRPTFSSDIFRLEISGLDEDHLSVIDVPGIFRNTTPGIITKSDIGMVREMVLGYMKNPRSIMLMVIPANVDIATQEIIEMARELDPEGGRTLGVLTKPDLVDQGAEAKVMDIVLGKRMPLRHGWVVIRNLGQRELEDGRVDRDIAEEEFRRSDPWKFIPPERFGIGALRRRLQEVVTENARRSFPLVRSEISKRLKEAKAALRVLGGERETTEQQAAFLLDIITRFQQLAAQALSTNYAADDTFDEFEELRLATIVMNRSNTFCEDMARYGHKYEKKSDNDMSGADEATKETTGVMTRKIDNVTELVDLLPCWEEESLPLKVDVKEWLLDLYTRSRGFEVGTFNTCLLATSMNKQSSKWPNFALGYIADIITAVHPFIVKALELVCPDKHVVAAFGYILSDQLLERYQAAIKQVEFLLRVERNGTPMTVNHYFNETLQILRQTRVQTTLEDKIIEDDRNRKVVRLADIKPPHHMGNVEQIVEEAYDILKSYYKVALKRFVDNVFQQAAFHHLIDGPDTPLGLLSPALVTELSLSQVQEIAGEQPALRQRQAQLKKEIAELEAGRRILL
ncbi:P-loop containing nucleoside triphosphate hydrolase protein [Aspergillus floccosus]